MLISSLLQAPVIDLSHGATIGTVERVLMCDMHGPAFLVIRPMKWHLPAQLLPFDALHAADPLLVDAAVARTLAIDDPLLNAPALPYGRPVIAREGGLLGHVTDFDLTGDGHLGLLLLDSGMTIDPAYVTVFGPDALIVGDTAGKAEPSEPVPEEMPALPEDLPQDAPVFTMTLSGRTLCQDVMDGTALFASEGTVISDDMVREAERKGLLVSLAMASRA